MPHLGVVNLLLEARARYLPDPGTVFGVPTPYVFDVSVYNIFSSLTVHCGICYLLDDGASLAMLSSEDAITRVAAVPSVLPVARFPRTVKAVEVGGEALTRRAVDNVRLATSIYNYYGPTEAAIWATRREVPRGELSSRLSSIGRPLPNVTCYIVDSKRLTICSPSLQPVGTYGELWLGGMQVARGYLKRPEQSAAVFVSQVWQSTDASGCGLVYRTGDLASWHTDGEIEFGGRVDTQVKLRGQRIELGEIEQALASQANVVEVVVLLRDDAGPEPMLVAYIHPPSVLSNDAMALVAGGALPFDHVDALGGTRALLPAYMLPSLVVGIDMWPRTSSNKIDRKSLPRPIAAAATMGSSQISRPRNNPCKGVITQVVARIAELLSSSQLDLDAPLMATGMNSLLAVSTARALSDEFGTPMTPTLAFDHPTARLLAHAIDATRAGAAPIDSASVLLSSDGLSSGQHSDVIIDASVTRMPACASTFTRVAVARLVSGGCDAMCEVPTARWQVPHMPSAVNASRVRHGSFICNAEGFDHAAFDVSPREASAMDPQQRLVLECGYDSLHTATFDRSTLHGMLVGVVLGIVHSEFEQVLLGSPAGRSVYAVTGATHSIAAGRLPYILDLHGPCVAYDTFCSSTLVATHAALTALQRSECVAALSEGVNLMLLPAFYEVLAVSGMISIGGHCHTFDQRADGYARGEACGAFVLHPPPDARDDLAIASVTLLGSAVRHDGRSASLTAPNGLAQQGLIHTALENAAILTSVLALSETHGTGTSLGDPIEASSLVQSVLVARSVPLAVGGVKANIGHAEATAGMTGLVKLALSLQSCWAAPNAQLRVLNPILAMTLSAVPCALAVQLSVPTEEDASRRCGGVSSFGYNGTIAHSALRASSAAKVVDGVIRLRQSLLAFRCLSFPWHETIPGPLAPSFENLCSLSRLRQRPARTANEMVALQLHESTRMAIVQLNDPGNDSPCRAHCIALAACLPGPSRKFF